MNFELKELLPIIEKLSEKFTSKESTSITYERARILMEAVLYCIHQCEDGSQLYYEKGLSAKDAYQIGYERVRSKVKETKEIYHALIKEFCAYGNENYYDTVTKAIPGFFIYYDALFEPQNTIITMDYPTLIPIVDQEGIDAIERYVTYITYEQKFLNALPFEYVSGILYRFDTSYRTQFNNICSIILRHVLGCMLISKKLGAVESMEDYEALCQIVKTWDESKLQQQLLNLLKNLIQKNYKNDLELYDYLSRDIEEFVVYLRIGAKHNRMRKVVVL